LGGERNPPRGLQGQFLDRSRHAFARTGAS